jgi:phage terminase large subunit-like protein
MTRLRVSRRLERSLMLATDSRPTVGRRTAPPPPPTNGPRDYAVTAAAYIDDVLAGREIAGKWLRLACARQRRDLERSRDDATWPYEWSGWHANDVCDFIEKLPHIEGAWLSKTIRLERVQIFLLTTLFGWRTRAGGRRFSMAYICAARKFAKSTLAAAITLYCLCCEGELGPQVIIGATTGQQAQKVFRPASEMVKRTPDLREAFGLAAWAHSITCEQNGGFIQTINAKGSTQDGWNPYLAILDELHAHPTPALFNVIRSSLGSRPNQLVLIVTTAGFNIAGVCYEQQSLVTKILEGVVQADHYFGVVFAIDEGDEVFDEQAWPKANPMIGITPTWDKMREYAAEARNSPNSLGEFTTKRCNVWSGSAQAWLNLAKWDACKDDTLRIDDFIGQPCWIGGDLSDCNDITAAVLMFRLANLYVAFPYFFLPKELVEARASAATAHYAAWARGGYLELTEGNAIDHNYIESKLRGWCTQFDVRAIVFDRYQSAQLMTSLATDGLPAIVLPKNASNWTPPCQELEKVVLAGQFRHTGHPVYRWMASNVCVSKRIDKSLLTKKETPMSPNKIDGIDATIEGMYSMLLPEQKPPSFQLLILGAH